MMTHATNEGLPPWARWVEDEERRGLVLSDPAPSDTLAVVLRHPDVASVEQIRIDTTGETLDPVSRTAHLAQLLRRRPPILWHVMLHHREPSRCAWRDDTGYARLALPWSRLGALKELTLDVQGVLPVVDPTPIVRLNLALHTRAQVRWLSDPSVDWPCLEQLVLTHRGVLDPLPAGLGQLRAPRLHTVILRGFERHEDAVQLVHAYPWASAVRTMRVEA